MGGADTGVSVDEIVDSMSEKIGKLFLPLGIGVMLAGYAEAEADYVF